MKKYLQALFLLLCPLLLTACGTGSTNQQTEYYDIRVEETEIFNSQEPGWYYGFQFYGDDMIQIMLEYITEGNRVWIREPDGSSRLLLPEYSQFNGSWFLTSQGQSILFYKETSDSEAAIRVLSPEGETLSVHEGLSGRSVCETADGNVYLLAGEDGNTFLAQLNLSTGTLRELEGLSLNLDRQLGLNVVPVQCLGLGPEGLMLMDGNGVWKITEDGSGAEKELVLSFDSTSYTDMSSDPATNTNLYIRVPSGFRMLEDGSVELLWKYRASGRGLLQTLRYEKAEKTVLRLRCCQLTSWMAECITEFNRTNEAYQIVIEQCSVTGQGFEDFCQRTDMEIAAGKGADLISGTSSNFNALMEKGALADLTPCLEQYGIAEEDYFPLTFARNGSEASIYGVMPQLFCDSLWISRKVLDENQAADIETVVNALYRYPEKGSFENFPEKAILTFFLEGSENLWGMVDYENGACNFNTKLFRKILEIAQRYSRPAYMDSPAILGHRSLLPLGFFDSERELSDQDRIPLGHLFADGAYPVSFWNNLLVVNENSANKEGCLAFISFLLQEDTQRKMLGKGSVEPVSRRVFAEMQAYALKWSGQTEYFDGAYGIFYGECTEEEAAEQLEIIENSRYLPLGTGDILGIIRDEAQDYLDGVKPMEVIIENINNRVQLYLNER